MKKQKTIVVKKDEIEKIEAEKKKKAEKLKTRIKNKLKKTKKEVAKTELLNQTDMSNIAELLTKAIERNAVKSASETEKEEKIKELLEENKTLKAKLTVAITRYRTKYMEMTHYKKQSRAKETLLTNIIEDLKAELIKHSPDNDLFETIEAILNITTNKNHVARKKSLKVE